MGLLTYRTFPACRTLFFLDVELDPNEPPALAKVRLWGSEDKIAARKFMDIELLQARYMQLIYKADLPLVSIAAVSQK